ncbi:expressed unknown protein [Seminavis robusta]|uniref:Uncharacterized protein n=1 Tax=Seminavis robusta TaxID=568900 RepID=A0A9N8HM84_9STRA|nr:expressed unknown protein [Seminavis robusta]|eukprot:Sro887_g216250.1 n/a (519) ;mRNA; f:3060-4616
MSTSSVGSPLMIEDSTSQPLLSLSEHDESMSVVKMDPLTAKRWTAVASIGVCVFLAFPIFGAVGTTNNHSEHHAESRLVSRTSPTLTTTLLPRKEIRLQDNDDAALDISVIGDPINVWRSPDSYHRCHQIDVPDIPTRAFAETNNNHQHNKIHMIQGSTEYHIMTGSSLLDVKRNCDIAFNKTANPDPSQFAANEFLDSPVAFPNNNGTVVAISHTEFPGNRYDQCPLPKAYPHCWTVTMGLMISHDFGRTWAHARPPPHHLVAAVPYQYNATQLASGWGDPSNILRSPLNDGYYYMAAWNRNTVGLQSAGVCMMRTKTLMDPSSWRGWNGHDYSVSFVSPYVSWRGWNGIDYAESFVSPYPSPKDDEFDPAHHICTVLDVDTSQLDPTQCNPFGLVWSPSLELFLLTWGCLNGYGPFYVTTSTDLIHWSAPQHLYDKSMLPLGVAKNVTSMHYPNLMDVAAPDQFGDANYNTIGATPHLFWVSFGHNVYADGRSAWATPLRMVKRQDDTQEETSSTT